MPIWMSFCVSVGCIVFVGIVSNLIGELFPRSWFHPERFPFRSARFEQDGKIYEKFGVHRWKDHVPDMSRVRKKKMVPKHLGLCPTACRVHTLLLETCRAEAVHAILCLLSFGLFFLWENPWLGAGVTLIYILCNFPFIVIQRYNRPALIRLEQKLVVREARKEQKRLAAAEKEEATIHEKNTDSHG